MRTIASTFSTREEAEAASRRLETLGVAPDRVEMKFLADAGEFFISAKVGPDQIDAATEILKRPTGDAAPMTAPATEVRPVEGASAPTSRDFGFAPEPRVAREASVVARSEPLAAGASLPPDPESYRPIQAGGGGASTARMQASSADGDWSGLGRRTVIFCLVLLVAFIAGALLGLVT